MKVYQCEDSLEGVFTAIYNIYEDRSDGEETVISLTEDFFLFAEYIPVEVDETKAGKVMNTLRRKFGEDNYMQICMALASEDIEKAQVVYRTIAVGLSTHCRPGHLLDNLAEDSVNRVFSLARRTNNEYLHLRGFVRFAELKNGVLYSKISPKNNILAFLMPHFVERFPMENFMIYDEKRNFFGIHPAQQDWYLLRNDSVNMEDNQLVLSDREEQYQELFKYFCEKIAISDRRNLELQRNMLPLKFRKYMTEFQ